jgi:hypothetical protein
LFEAADEVVDIMEPVVLDVERVPAEPCPWANGTPWTPVWDVDQRADPIGCGR